LSIEGCRNRYPEAFLGSKDSFGLLQFKPIKKPESFDSGFPCREEHGIIEPDLEGVGGN